MPDNRLNCVYLGYKLNTSIDRLAVNGSLVDDYILLPVRLGWLSQPLDLPAASASTHFRLGRSQAHRYICRDR
jgi:hypothetical protein